MRTPNQSLVPKPTEDGMAMVGQGPRAVFLCNTADFSRHRVELKTLLQATLARMAAKDPATGGLLSGPKYGDAAENSPVSITRKHAAEMGEKEEASRAFFAALQERRKGGGCRCAGSGRRAWRRPCAVPARSCGCGTPPARHDGRR